MLGLRLRPFSFWHEACLDYVSSPFAGHGGRIDNIGLLWVATRICQTRAFRIPQRSRFEYAREMHAAWKYNERPIVLSRGSDPLRVTTALLREVRKFIRYLNHYRARPIYGSGSDSIPLNLPWYAHEVAKLRRFAPRLTKAQAWDMPVSAASWDNAAMSEAHGERFSVQTPEDRKAEAEAIERGAIGDFYFDEGTNTWRSR